MLRRLYDRVLALSASRAAPVWLAVIAFAEASVFPIPPDALLIPMVLARPRRAAWLASLCTLASVAGGAAGYAIGALLFHQLAQPILQAYGYGHAYAAFQSRFAEYGAWIVLVKGLTPIPYKIVTIAAGAARFDFGVFMLCSLVTRGLRFGLVALLLRYFGEPARHFIERRLTLITCIALAAVVLGFAALRYL